MLLLLCSILTWGGAASAQSQTSIAPTFFGSDTSICNPTNSGSPCYTSGIWEPWWPPSSSPGVDIGFAGKVPQATWDALDGNPAESRSKIPLCFQRWRSDPPADNNALFQRKPSDLILRLHCHSPGCWAASYDRWLGYCSSQRFRWWPVCR